MKFAHRFLSTMFALLLLASFAVVMPACNTVKGLGEDIQIVGEAGEDAITGDDDDYVETEDDAEDEDDGDDDA